MGGWRKLHSEELVLIAKFNDNNHVEEDEMGRACSTTGEILKACRMFVESQEEKGHWEDLAEGVG
jgi:hypothetical protein